MPRSARKQRREKEYAVESIDDAKFENGKWWFFIKWQGYPSSQNTWEPTEHLDKCPKTILHFFATPLGLTRQKEMECKMREDEAVDHQKQLPKLIMKIPVASSNLPVPSPVSDNTTSSSLSEIKFPSSEEKSKQTLNIVEDMSTDSRSNPSDESLTNGHLRFQHDPSRQFESSSSSDLKDAEDKDESESSSSSDSEQEEEQKFGFDKGYEPEYILGATREFQDGALMFLIKWRGVIEADLVAAEEARFKCPDLVIDFFEERLVFEESSAVED